LDGLRFVLLLAAGLQPFGHRGVGGEALGEGDDGLLDLGLGEAFVVEQAFV
jgi:hypothetical protein